MNRRCMGCSDCAMGGSGSTCSPGNYAVPRAYEVTGGHRVYSEGVTAKPKQARTTFYKGIRFRSRLEARWAAYWDARGWKWVYEPMDLKNYIPDFMVEEPGRGRVMVEVKPATKLGQLAPAILRISTKWKGPWMVVGADPDMCVQGRGSFAHQYRHLGYEAWEAWAQACNATQWVPNQTYGTCVECGKEMMFLHKLVCKGAKTT